MSSPRQLRVLLRDDSSDQFDDNVVDQASADEEEMELNRLWKDLRENKPLPAGTTILDYTILDYTEPTPLTRREKDQMQNRRGGVQAQRGRHDRSEHSPVFQPTISEEHVPSHYKAPSATSYVYSSPEAAPKHSDHRQSNANALIMTSITRHVHPSVANNPTNADNLEYSEDIEQLKTNLRTANKKYLDERSERVKLEQESFKEFCMKRE